MTRADLYDWFLVNKCKIEPLGQFTTGNAIKVISPKIDSAYIYLDLPIDEKPVKSFSVCNMCDKLFIPSPNFCQHMQQLVDHIKKNHTKENT